MIQKDVSYYTEIGIRWLERMSIFPSDLAHKGNENSGRYSRGSGKRPYQHAGKQLKKGGIIKGAPDVVTKALKMGTVKLDVNPQLQKDHCEFTHEPGKGYIKGGMDNARKLIEELHGTGDPVIDSKGNWTRKERVKAKGNPAVNEFGNDTNALMIHYSRTGAHIMTRQEDNNEKGT